MKKASTVSPVMLEILVVTLFLALSASVLVQLIAKAHDISRSADAESRALILAEDTVERLKADPVGDNAFDAGGVRTFTVEAGDVSVRGDVTRTASDAGAYYAIRADAYNKDALVLTLSTGRYLPETEVAP